MMQVTTDNGPQYKITGKILIEQRLHIFWNPYAAHCLNLMLIDIGKLGSAKDDGLSTEYSKFIYNHRSLSLMPKYTGDIETMCHAI